MGFENFAYLQSIENKCNQGVKRNKKCSVPSKWFSVPVSVFSVLLDWH